MTGIDTPCFRAKRWAEREVGYPSATASVLAAISRGFSPRPTRSPKPRLRLCFEKHVTIRSPKPLSPVKVSGCAPQATPKRRISTIARVTKAALVTRAIVEIRRLGVACGAQAETFTGLSGLGDLMVTCFSKHSRNRGFGERVGRGEKPRDIAASTLAVAEGYPTSRSAYRLARQHGVSMPVIDEVYAMLYEDKDVAKAVKDLMSRDLKPEN